MEFVNYYNRNTLNHVGTANEEESLTDQSFKNDSDINNLVYMHLNGLAPRTPVTEPVYNENNYETANWTFEDWQNQKAMIERKFLHLTPELKAKFVTPANFFKYCSNPENFIITENGMEKKPDPEPFVPPVTSQVQPPVQKPVTTTE